MVSTGEPGVTSDELEQLIRTGLTSSGRVSPAPAVILHLRPGPDDESAWAALEQFLRLVRLDPDAPVFAGFYRSGSSETARHWLQARPQEVCLVPGTDWDWVVWPTTMNELGDLYRSEHEWPDLLLPAAGGWILETPPSSNDSYLYPATVTT